MRVGADKGEVDPTGIAAILNPETIARLRKLEGESAGLLAELLDLFTTQSPVYLAAIRAGFAARDEKAVRLAAHTLKGSSANIGATVLTKLAQEIESCPANLDSEIVATALEREIEVARAAFAEVVSAVTHGKPVRPG
jgi:HPt (histidine-containing phosphotransfer) domain-containing protein